MWTGERMSELIPVIDEGEIALSAAEIAEIDAEIAHVPYRAAVAIDALKIVQAHRGWVSDQSLRAIARHLHMSAAELDGIATFYNLIFRQPVGDKVILLCNSISCWIKGCDSLQPVSYTHLTLPTTGHGCCGGWGGGG